MDKKLKGQLRYFFETEFADIILEKLKSGHKLSKFNVNPFIVTALSSGVLGSLNSINMAKALLYPRVFGTSISTTFGEKMQKMCIMFLGANASGTPGMDIEFKDKKELSVDTNYIIQLKAGPNTINSGDVNPIVSEMNAAYRLLLRNHVATMPTFALGIVYGTIEEVSGHYKKIATSSVGGQMKIPILIGKDFWWRLTGEENFYDQMVAIFIELFKKKDFSKLLEDDIIALAKQIKKEYFKRGKISFIK